MSVTRTVDVGRLIDDSPLSRFQISVLGICFLISAIEGFDVQAIAFAAPSLAKQWALTPTVFGSIFSAGLFGGMLGSLVMGVIQDKTGRRPALIGSVAAFSVLTLLTALAGDFKQLIFLRFLAGVGLGAAIPIYMSYASEFSPARLRTTTVAMTVAAFPIGAVLGGIAASALIGRFGWQIVFWVGGLGPLCLVPVVAVFMPESVRFLAIRDDTRERVAAILRKINPTLEFSPDTVFCLDEIRVRGAKLPALFMKPLLPGTILLPLALFSSLLLTYCLLNWLPLLINQLGFTVAEAVWGTVAYNLSSVVGSLGLTLLIDRTGRPLLVLGLAYIVGCFAVATIGFASHTFPVMMAAIFTAEFVAGPQVSLNALMANFYPTAVRGTGIGWGLGIGRIGSLSGPLVGGYLVALHTGTPRLLQIVSLAALVSAACLLILIFFKAAAHAAAVGGTRGRVQDALRMRDDTVSHLGEA